MIFVSFLLLLALLVIAARASLKLFLLTGEVSGRNGEVVELVRDFGGGAVEVLSSCTILNNQFRMSCPVIKTGLVTVLFKDGSSYRLMLKQGHVNVNIDDGNII